ncbi:hypothetical protein DFJ74DRAFT_666333 [Hyaloraphidium curvatum]|nr:hypothetical protein DFJ74DRAFT_666333 [Hyaloraphidium curvatum]
MKRVQQLTAAFAMSHGAALPPARPAGLSGAPLSAVAATHSSALANGSAAQLASAAAEISKINVFDFDNTIFGSPLPSRDLWDGTILRVLTGSYVPAIGWWTDPRSLVGMRDEGWDRDGGWVWDESRWSAETAGKVYESMADPKALTVLLTGRGHLKFNKLVRRLCESRNFEFDVLGLKPPNDPATGSWSLPFEPVAVAKKFPEKLTYTHEVKAGERVQRFMGTLMFKKTFLEALALTFPSAKELRIYEDRPGHAREFERIGAEMVQRGLVEKCESIQVPPLTAPMPPASELSFVLKMIHESNEGFSRGMTVFHRDEDTMLSAELVGEDGQRVEGRENGTAPQDLSLLIGVEDIGSMDTLRVLERGEDGKLSDSHYESAWPAYSDPGPNPDTYWAIVTYAGPAPYSNRRVIGPLRPPHYLEVVRIRGPDGKVRLGCLPEPPLGKDAVDE